MKELTTLLLYGNGIGQSLPEKFGMIERLSEVDIEFNDFSGDLFNAGFNELADTLTTFRASFNSFTGPIPSYVKNFQILVDFWVGDNMLSGVIPDEITMLPSLRKFFVRMIGHSLSFPCFLTKLHSTSPFRRQKNYTCTKIVLSAIFQRTSVAFPP